jgi:hypothetical protein
VAADDPQQAAFAFVGTVERLGATTMPDLAANERTAVFRVDRVVRAPAGFTDLTGQEVTLVLAPGAPVPAAGETLGLLANGLAFGDGIALGEIARVAPDELERLASAPARRHAEDADAVVSGRVERVEDVGGWRGTEHDPAWRRAVIAVHRVERGDVAPGELAVLFPSSEDVRWAAVPKPRPGEAGTFLLHAAAADVAGHAPFQLLHPEDFSATP